MPDTTGSGTLSARGTDAIPQRMPAATESASCDDRVLARLLITNWTLATGRALPAGVPPASLSTDELIRFWADDHITAPDQVAADAALPGAAR